MANEALLNTGTKLTLGATGTTSAISDAAYQECTDDTRTSSDDTGYPLGIFEFKTAAGGFSVAPTAGAAIHIFEQRIHTGGDQPDVDSSYEHNYLCTFNVDPADAQQFFVSSPVPIAIGGAKYWVQWVDGGAGTASVDAGWELTLTPCTYGT